MRLIINVRLVMRLCTLLVIFCWIPREARRTATRHVHIPIALVLDVKITPPQDVEPHTVHTLQGTKLTVAQSLLAT